MADQPLTGRGSVGYYDEAFEFDAPKHVDFAELADNSDIMQHDGADTWFDRGVAGDGEPIVTDETFSRLITDDLSPRANIVTPLHHKAVARRPTTAKRTGRGSLAAQASTNDAEPQQQQQATSAYAVTVDNTQTLQAALNDSNTAIDTDEPVSETLSVPVVPNSARRQSRRISGNKRKSVNSDVVQGMSLNDDDDEDEGVKHFPHIEKIDIQHIQPRSAVKLTAHRSALGAARRVSVQQSSSAQKAKRASVGGAANAEDVHMDIAEVKRPSAASASSRLTQPTASSTARNSLANSNSERRLTVRREVSLSRKNSITRDSSTERRVTRSAHSRQPSIESHNSAVTNTSSQMSSTMPSYARPTQSARSRASMQNVNVSSTPQHTSRSRTQSMRPSTAGKPASDSVNTSHHKRQRTGITVPVSPKLSTANRMSRRPSITKTREDEVMEQIEIEKRAVKQQSEYNKVAVQHVLQPVETHVPVRSTQQLTQPKEFHLSTDQRARMHQDEQPAQQQQAVKPKLPYRPGQLTQPQPFNLATEQRVKHGQAAPMMSSEDRVVQEMEQHGPFKALELDDRVLHSLGDVGVPKVNTKEPTKPQEFRLATGGRVREKPMSTADKELAELGLPLEKEPQRPQTASQRRRTVTDPKPFNLQTDERGVYKQSVLQQRVQQVSADEERQHHFKAAPMVVVDQPMQIHHQVKVTEPKPFKLQSEKLHQQYQQQRSTQLEHEQEREEEQRHFRAAGVPEVVYNPDLVFKPKPADKPLTEVTHRGLKSDERAMQRAAYDGEMAEKNAEREEYEVMAKAERDRREAEQIAHLRQSQVHKPLPVPSTHSRPAMEVRKSTRPLTEPHTPALMTKQRAAMQQR